MRGRIVLVPTPIGNLGDITLRAIETLRCADVIACEDTRHSRKLLSHLQIEGKQLVSLHDHNERDRAAGLLSKVADGATVAVISDAGTPGISDPGMFLVAEAVAAGVMVESLPGPSAMLSALTASGLDTQEFRFVGFLPSKKKELLDVCENISRSSCTTIAYEAPHRLRKTLLVLGDVCGKDRQLVIARELTKIHEEYIRGTIEAVYQEFKDRDVKGELVLVIGAAPVQQREVTDDEIQTSLRVALEQGVTNRDAVARVANELGVNKRRVYSLSLEKS